jgi:hypothetical protein
LQAFEGTDGDWAIQLKGDSDFSFTPKLVLWAVRKESEDLII